MADSQIEIDDVEDALRRADELAELTGRDKADVIADLLDDGQLNMSAGADLEPEKDFLDVAQEKAEKLKTLLITIAPIIALLSGIGLEGAGILDLTDWGSDSVWDDGDPPNEPPYIDNDMWGCTAWDAENFNPNANRDDGSCYWDDSPPIVYGCMDPGADNYDAAATEDDGTCYYEPDPELDIQNQQLSLVGDDELKAEFNLYIEGDFCCDDVEIAWEIQVDGYYDDGLRKTTFHSYDETGYLDFVEYWPDMGAGDYQARIEVKWMNDLWDEETTSEVTIEEPIVWGCMDSGATNYDPEANEDDGSCEYPIETHCDEGDVSLSGFWSNVRPDNTSVRVSFKINIADGEEVDCTESFFEIEVRLENSGQVLAGPTNLSELISGSEREITVVFEDLNPGDHAPGVWVRYQGNLVAQNWLWTVNVPEPEVECAIDFYDFVLSYQTNNTEALQFYSDPDEINGCGEQVTVDVVWTLFDENGTETNLEYRLNTTGAEWDQMTLYTENLTLGNYSAEVELFFVIDGERAADPEKVYTWTNIEIKENDEDE